VEGERGLVGWLAVVERVVGKGDGSGVDWADGSGAPSRLEDSVVIISDPPKPGQASL
jgi:hypothetical protein